MLNVEMARSRIIESKNSLATLEPEHVTGLDICHACSKAKFNDLNELGPMAEEMSSRTPPHWVYKRMSKEIARTYQECWLCRLIHRFCAQLLPDDNFVKWCTENVEVTVLPSNSIWKTQFLGIGAGESPEVTLDILMKGPGLEYDHFRLTCYPKDNLPTRLIDRTISTQVTDQAYIHKIERWLSSCISSHTKCAVLRNSKSTSNNALDLINVRTREIVATNTEQRYVALSFVWGKDPLRRRWPDEKSAADLDEFIRNARRARRLPANLPPAFADAIILTKSLGETYLWIDCFCIEQDDPELRQSAINSMNAIYSGAFITICVLDLHDIFSGIPGISIPHHGRVRVITETETTSYFMTKYEDLNTLLSDCSWSARGWPFQEGALSTRRLCFHQQGVFLLCEEELFYDVMVFDQSSSRARTAFDIGRDYGLPFGINLDASSWEFGVYSRIVTAYTQRKLTFESDALNAVTGVLRAIAQSTGMSFVAGAPEHDLLNGLLWLHPKPMSMNGSFANMHRLHDINGHRRSEFPSWSWLGWGAPAKYLYWIKASDSAVSVQVEEYHLDMYSVNDDGQTLYKNAIFLKTHAIASIEYSPSSVINPILILKTQSIFLHVAKAAKSDQERAENGDHWIISDTKGQPINIDNVENFHNDALINFYVDLSTYQAICSVNIHSCISDRLSRQGTQCLEFVMLQHWLPTFRNEPEKVHQDSWSQRPYDMSELAERVWVMAVAPNKDGLAERIGITWIPGQQWRDAGPKDVTVRIV